jgi:mannitol-1-/sugar-/sorbitol-6-phosphatase
MTIRADAVLFDLDGVLVDSLACTAGAWYEWTREHGLDGPGTLAIGHGRTTLDHIRAVAPELGTPEEAARVDALEERYLSEVTAQPGAHEAIAALTTLGLSWGIVTSCGRPAALARLAAARLPGPAVLVTADDVARHKPAPDGYQLGCQRLGVAPATAVVFEDAPSGLAAARAAGTQVIAVQTTHRAEELTAADAIAADLAHVQFRPGGDIVIDAEVARPAR